MQRMTCRTLSLLALAGALLIGVAPAGADEYVALEGTPSDHLPADTATRGRSHPRYGPAEIGTHLSRDEQRAQMQTWAAAAESVALAHPGTRLAADLLHGAAHVHRRGSPLADLERYRRLALAGVDAHAQDDPAVAALMLGLAREELLAGNTPAAGRWLERVEGWSATVATWLSDGTPPARARALLRIWTNEYLPVRARWLEAVGRTKEAAEALERHVGNAPPSEHARRWRHAAEAYARAGETEDALRTAARAHEAASSDAARGDHLLWALYARHDLLDARGKPATLSARNGWATTEAFRVDLQTLLGEIGRLTKVTTLYLELGSRAHLRGDEATALDIYVAAMDNPSVANEASGQRDLWEGLLVAFAAAIRLERFDDAERILATVARIGSVPAERFDTLLVWLKNRRADAAQLEALKRRIAEEAKRRREQPGVAPPPAQDRDPTLGVEHSGTDDDVPFTPAEEDPPVWPWLLAALALVLIAVFVARR